MKTIERKMPIPQYIQIALDRLEERGFKGYVVGGCVRDFLMGKKPHDYDIATDALPTEMLDAFKDFHCEESGLKHGTVRVIIQRDAVEITTFRTEGRYSDQRHPDNVTFVKDMESDSDRRDFTINSLYYSNGTIYDPHDGTSDMERGVIKAIGEPQRRFEEDALRILRAIRFSSRFHYAIDEGTIRAMVECKDELRNISVERILMELYSICTTTNFYRSIVAYRPIYEVTFDSLEGVDLSKFNFDINSSGDQISTLSALFSLPFMIDSLDEWIARMKLDSHTRHGLSILTRLRDIDFSSDWDSRFINRILMDSRSVDRGQLVDYLRNLCLLKNIKDSGIEDKLARMESARDIPVSTKDLKLDGDDLTMMGIKGRMVGQLLNKLLEETNQGYVKNEKDAQLDWVSKQLECM